MIYTAICFDMGIGVDNDPPFESICVFHFRATRKQRAQERAYGLLSDRIGERPDSWHVIIATGRVNFHIGDEPVPVIDKVGK